MKLLLRINIKKDQAMAKKVTKYITAMLAGMVLLVNTGCGSSSSSPITIVFPSRSDSTDLQQKADAVAKVLSQEAGLEIKAKVSDETAAVESLNANQADIAFLGSRGALKAEKLTQAKMHLAEVRSTYSGGHTYNSIFVVPKDSKLTDLKSLKGQRMAFTSPTSGSGFIFPVSTLMSANLVSGKEKLDQFFGKVTYGGNYGKALQSVLRGQADVAAVSEYAMSEPHITAAEAQKLKVIHKTGGVPAHGVVIDDDVPAPVKEKIVSALLKMNAGSNNALLKSLYNSTELVKVDHDSHLAPMKKALASIGMEP
jgi:phosphonate transport system substrate-binding protein